MEMSEQTSSTAKLSLLFWPLKFKSQTSSRVASEINLGIHAMTKAGPFLPYPYCTSTASPPYPHRIPTISPPYHYRTPTVPPNTVPLAQDEAPTADQPEDDGEGGEKDERLLVEDGLDDKREVDLRSTVHWAEYRFYWEYGTFISDLSVASVKKSEYNHLDSIERSKGSR